MLPRDDRTFDARDNDMRIGRVPLARRRESPGVAIRSTLGPSTLTNLRVRTDELPTT